MATSRCSQFVRQFSTSVARAGKLVQSPIQLYGVDGRYATALYSAASKQNKLDSVEKDLISLQAELKKDKKLLEFLSDPSQKRVQKRAAIQKLMKQKNFSELTVNLFVALSDNGRIGKAEQVLSSFSRIMSAHRGEVPSTVITAKPLDDASLNELKSALQGFLKKGQSLRLHTEIDPALIGGMKITIGDRYVDMSMASRIKSYTELIKQAV